MLRSLRRYCYRRLIRSDRLQGLFRHSIAVEQERRNFVSRFTIDNRIRGYHRAILVVAGYKPWLWNDTLARIKRFAPAESDVCIVSPGLRSESLGRLCSSYGWSYLVTPDNKLALAQNLAIERHPRALLIHKLDEDIFVSGGYFEALEAGLLKIRALDVCDPGLTVPVLNVNGYSYRVFLEIIGKLDAYRTTFGESKISCMDVRAWKDGDASFWLWERSLPFDKVSAEFAAGEFSYSLVPHRFSIGAILIEREMWQRIGGFSVGSDGALGYEEEHLCAQCMTLSRPIVCIHNALAGHFAFHPQERFMREQSSVLRALDGTLVLQQSDDASLLLSRTA